MPKNKEESDEEYETDQKELSSLERRRLRVIEREEFMKKENVMKKMKN